MTRNLVLVAAALIALAGASVANAGGIDLYAAGLQLGLAKPDMQDGGITLGAYADLGEVAPNVVLFPSIGYMSSTVAESVDGSAKYSISEFAINADAHYYINPEAPTNFYVGAGLGFFVIQAELKSIYGSGRGSTEDFGINLLGGVEGSLSQKARWNVEGRLSTGGLDAVKILGGVSFELNI